jgi:hypothetical protein
MDPEFRYGKLYQHFKAQGSVIDYWNLPGGQGPVVNTVNRDGVMIMETAQGNFLFIQQHDVAQGDVIFHDRYVNEPSMLHLDALVTDEEQAEINAERALIRQNLAFVEHHEVVERLRGYCSREASERFLIATQTLTIPGLTRKQILEECRNLREARLEVARLERFSEGRLMSLVRAMLLECYREHLERALVERPHGAILLPDDKKVILVDDGGKSLEVTQQDLDQAIGQLYRTIKGVEAAETAEELLALTP